MTFLLSEDNALRNKIQGIVVNDQRATNDSAPRQVGVFFGQPDQELRPQNYPYITIDMIDIQKDGEREMRGIVPLPPYYFDSLPVGYDDSVETAMTHLPIPAMIDYQITTYSRQPRHDREIIAQLLYSKLPFRFGVLELDDGTVRRLDVLDVSKRDVTEQAKRLFVNAVTVRVSTEIAQDAFYLVKKVQQVKLDKPSQPDAGGRPGDPTFIGIGMHTIPE
jgi:hypothetical protein